MEWELWPFFAYPRTASRTDKSIVEKQEKLQIPYTEPKDET